VSAVAAAKGIGLVDLTSSLRDHISMLESLKKGTPEIIEILDGSLNRLFTGIDSRSFYAQDAEVDELNALFEMLGKRGRAKAKRFKLVYKQPRVQIKQSRGKARIHLFSAEGMVAERPRTQPAAETKAQAPIAMLRRVEEASPEMKFKSTFEWRLVEKEVAGMADRAIAKGDLTTSGKRIEIVQNVVNELLDKYLPKVNSYHNKNHTKEVYEAAKLLARVAELDRDETEKLLVAALFHDTGFTAQYSKNEPVGAEIAAIVMRKMGYEDADIETVKSTIVNGTTFDAATSSQPLAKTKLEMLLADADLSHLGGNFDHFKQTGRDLRKELESKGIKFADGAWDKGQVAILNHKYLTEEAAVVGLANGQKRNLQLVEDNLAGTEV
jgi:predicted metal-dependent HD superfamily phosphohydrolase